MASLGHWGRGFVRECPRVGQSTTGGSTPGAARRPCRRERRAAGDRTRRGQEEPLQRRQDSAKRRQVEGGPPCERAPLRLLRRGEGRGERERRFLRERGLPPRECRRERTGERCPVEVIVAGEYPEVEEVFHAAVRHAERRERLELLGHHRLARI